MNSGDKLAMLEATYILAVPLVLSRVETKPPDEGRCGSTLSLELGQKGVGSSRFQCRVDLVPEARAPRA